MGNRVSVLCALALFEAFCFFCLFFWLRGSIPRRSCRSGRPSVLLVNPFCGVACLCHSGDLTLCLRAIALTSLGGCSFAQNIKNLPDAGQYGRRPYPSGAVKAFSSLDCLVSSPVYLVFSAFELFLVPSFGRHISFPSSCCPPIQLFS